MEYEQRISQDDGPDQSNTYVTSLKFLPGNHPDGIKINFSTLPRFETTVNEIRNEHEKNSYVISDPQ